MIELASVIRGLREELEQAIATGEGAALRFELGPIELEVAVAVERSDGGAGKLRFWVVELEADRKRDTTGTQRIKLALTPRLDGHASGEGIYVSGQAVPGEE